MTTTGAIDLMAEAACGLEAGCAVAWDRLHTPIWVFDPVELRGIYANAPALELWEAKSLRELLSRDFSQISPAVRARTDRLAELTARGKTVRESWTFFPRGRPHTVHALISSIPVNGVGQALLFEATAVDVDEDERRAVEALRHTSSLISLFDSRGQMLFSNPAAFAAYQDGGFHLRFRNPRQAEEAVAQMESGEILATLVDVETRKGRRSHHMDARQVTDPVSGRLGILLSERDVTAQVEAERALVVARERIDAADAREAVRRVERRLRETSEARLRGVFETSYQMQTLLDTKGVILDTNKVSLAAIHAPLNVVKGQRYWESPWFNDAPDVATFIRDQMPSVAGGQPVRKRVWLDLPKGGRRIFDFTLRPIWDEQATVMAIVAEAAEITENEHTAVVT